MRGRDRAIAPRCVARRTVARRTHRAHGVSDVLAHNDAQHMEDLWTPLRSVCPRIHAHDKPRTRGTRASLSRGAAHLGAMSDANARAGSSATATASSSSSSSSSSDWNDAIDTIKRHKLRVVGGIWACGMVGAFAFQSFGARAATKQTSVKIIHSRLYAQFATLSALVLGAGVEMIDRSAPTRAAVPDADAALEYAATHRARTAARTAASSSKT